MSHPNTIPSLQLTISLSPFLSLLFPLSLRFDESYSLHRRNALQEYLRMLARTPVVKYIFKSFSDFLEIPFDQLPPSEFDDEEKAASDTKTTDNPAFLPP